MSSQARQDDFVLSLIEQGFFLDVGCWYPETHSNSYKLEKNGWVGIAVDIEDLNQEWEFRDTQFIQADALKCNWGMVLNSMPMVIDYLSLDIDNNCYGALTRLTRVREFKIITIEHDIYKPGNDKAEAIPQRRHLTELGYDLVCKNVKKDTRPFEDWWVNPKYVTDYEHYRLSNMWCDEILKREK